MSPSHLQLSCLPVPLHPCAFPLIPLISSFYLANIVVETNRSLQLFSGGLSPAISTDWNQDGSFHKNTFYDGRPYNMGGAWDAMAARGRTRHSGPRL